MSRIDWFVASETRTRANCSQHAASRILRSTLLYVPRINVPTALILAKNNKIIPAVARWRTVSSNSCMIHFLIGGDNGSD